MPLYLEWFKCFGDRWCNLFEINLDHNHFDGLTGVYIIWYGEKKRTILKVGQGVIRERLSENRQDYVISAYTQYGLHVTWARVAEDECDGAERYIGETLKPVVGSRLAESRSIMVNLPWEESPVLKKKMR